MKNEGEQPATPSPKRNLSQSSEQLAASRKKPKGAAASTDFEQRSVHISEESVPMEIKEEVHVVYEEDVAVLLTSGQHEDRPRRRLTDFRFYDAGGQPQLIEMSTVDDLLIAGLILPLEDSSDKQNQNCVRCVGFGPIKSWSISGYKDGSPAIWVSTEAADYDCIQPAGNYKKFYDQFFEKAQACVEVYRKLSKSSGGNPDLSLDELLASVVQTISASKGCPSRGSIKDFIISHGEFIHGQLISLQGTSNQNDKTFSKLPVLVALRDEGYKRRDFTRAKAAYFGGSYMSDLGIIDAENEVDESGSSIYASQENNDLKLARLLQEEEYLKSISPEKIQGSAPFSDKYYIKINEDEIANDYPLPAYYKTSNEETDEFLFFDSDIHMCDTDELPRSMLQNWSLYNSDSRLISLELLPMKPCAHIDVTMFGSGVMTGDDGSGFCLDTDLSHSSSSNQEPWDVDGFPIYLSAIKEWTIDFGSSMIFISIRTDMAWYRLGKPSKQYTPWHEPVLKTAWLAISITTLLNEQSRIARLSFADAIKRISNFEKDHPAYISSNPADVERYVVVHGQIILQQFAELQDGNIKWSAFVTALEKKMEERRHTKLLVKKKKVVHESQPNMNPTAAIAPVMPKRKITQATITKMINRIWGEYYLNYLPEDSKEGASCVVKEEDEVEEEEENEDDEVEEEELLAPEKTQRPSQAWPGRSKLHSTSKEIRWEGESVGKISSGNTLYKHAIVGGDKITVGGAVLVEVDEPDELAVIYLVEYMFESFDGRKMFHGRMMQHGSKTVLGNTANARELFLMNNCLEFELQDIKQTVVVDIQQLPWGHQYRKANADFYRIDRVNSQEIRRKGLPSDYYCKSLYWPERGAFFSLPFDTMGIGTGFCHSCKVKESQNKEDSVKVNSYKTSFAYKGTEYSINDFVYVSPQYFAADMIEIGTFKAGRSKGLKAYVVCQILEIIVPKETKIAEAKSTLVKLRRFFRPEDISAEMAYTSDINEVYYSEEIHSVPVEMVKGKCEVMKKWDLPSCDVPATFEHVFFCERQFDPSKGSLKLLLFHICKKLFIAGSVNLLPASFVKKQLPANIKLTYSTRKALDAAAARKRKGKGTVEDDLEVERQKTAFQENCLATLDIFAGCGGLSEGLQQSGASVTKWAIEYEKAAGDAFKLNHPESFMFINNCNAILRAVMDKCGDADECVSASEADELANSLSEKDVNNLPLPGRVDFIVGGPPCRGFNQSTWSKVQCEMILAFLSFADYFRPRFLLLENARNFIYFNEGKTFHLTLASLLEMGYQVRFGILEAGSYGVSQSRKRVFIWAASPEETLPEWPEPMHVFAVPELKIALSQNMQYAAVRSIATRGAPFRAMTVADTIADLPVLTNGASTTDLEYQYCPVSWFQKKIRGNMVILTDHISKKMNALNMIRCQKIPKEPGADWHCLPDEKITLWSGEVVDLIPWYLPNTGAAVGKRQKQKQWKGQFGRLDWDGNFPSIIREPQAMGKVGMCFHPEQDRIVSVRECARSLGFPDRYKFSGNIEDKHRQIGNAVPPPLAFALGRMLKQALENKSPIPY